MRLTRDHRPLPFRPSHLARRVVAALGAAVLCAGCAGSAGSASTSPADVCLEVSGLFPPMDASADQWRSSADGLRDLKASGQQGRLVDDLADAYDGVAEVVDDMGGGYDAGIADAYIDASDRASDLTTELAATCE